MADKNLQFLSSSQRTCSRAALVPLLGEVVIGAVDDVHAAAIAEPVDR
jgi:hypothetical protein